MGGEPAAPGQSFQPPAVASCARCRKKRVHTCQQGVGGQLFAGSSFSFGHFSVVLSLLFQRIPKQVVCRDFASPLLNSHH